MNQSVWGSAQQNMSDLLHENPDDVPTVVAQLSNLQEVLRRLPSTPLCDFNRLYLTVTQGVLERLYAGEFRDPAFVSRLDVEFAARYFDALRAWAGPEAGARCPQVWSGLFRHMPRPGGRRLPPACAGINAHITFDLPFALVTTFDCLGTDPVDGTDQHHDYLRINEIFGESLPGGYLDRWQVLIDTMNGSFDSSMDDALGSSLDSWWHGEAIEYARNVAWRKAQKLWGMRHDMSATARERAHLDRISAALGMLLLSPLGVLLQ
jgi:hypothetical protein